MTTPTPAVSAPPATGDSPSNPAPPPPVPLLQSRVATQSIPKMLLLRAMTTTQESSFGDEGEPSTSSITSSIMAYQEENGRRYMHLAVEYILPNDEAESERLDIQHEAFIRTWDGELAMCPKTKGANRVLDIGTGTGIWAIDYADLHPEAEVIGVDLSPIQPPFFEIDDVEKPWTWTKPFDFIFARMMIGSFENMPEVIKAAYEHLEPGGYMELQDCCFPVTSDDGTLLPDSYLAQWSTNAMKMGASLGRPIWPATQYRSYLSAAGFQDIVEVQKKWPTNSWPKDKKHKEIGAWTYANVSGGLEGLSMAGFTRGLGMSTEETLLLLANTRKDLRNPKIHAYWPVYAVYGRKPLA